MYEYHIPRSQGSTILLTSHLLCSLHFGVMVLNLTKQTNEINCLKKTVSTTLGKNQWMETAPHMGFLWDFRCNYGNDFGNARVSLTKRTLG